MRVLKSLVMMVTLAMGTAAMGQEIGDDGLHKQPWFADTFLDMGEDLAEAAAQGKDLLIIIEQRGCPYCKEMHEVNFARAEIVDLITSNYMVVQLNMWGDREVVDFDGAEMTEKALVRRWGVSFTPTTLFFAADAAPEEALVFMLPGYFKPFHHARALEYVATDAYKDEPNFQRFVQARGDEMRAAGIEVEIWQ